MDGQKCRHEQCSCYVDLGMFYCSDRCRELDVKDGDAPPHGRCGCGHTGCLKGF
jgi:hypothetical protein